MSLPAMQSALFLQDIFVRMTLFFFGNRGGGEKRFCALEAAFHCCLGQILPQIWCRKFSPPLKDSAFFFHRHERFSPEAWRADGISRE